jgi:hypothetical protein
MEKSHDGEVEGNLKRKIWRVERGEGKYLSMLELGWRCFYMIAEEVHVLIAI